MTRRFLHKRQAHNFIAGVIVIAGTMFILQPSNVNHPVYGMKDLSQSIPAGTLTLVDGEQAEVQDLLKSGIKRYHAAGGVALLMRIDTGRVEALASYDEMGRENLNKLTDSYQPGSVMKPLTIATALHNKSIRDDYSYYDPGIDYIEGSPIVNAAYHQPARYELDDIIHLSLNTGAVNILKQVADSELSSEGCKRWYLLAGSLYHLNEPFRFANLQVNAAYFPPAGVPSVPYRCAQTAYGVGLAMSPLQLAAAYGMFVRDGHYSRPCIFKEQCFVDSKRTMSIEAALSMKNILRNNFALQHPEGLREEWTIGAKSGSAPYPNNAGTYVNDEDNGTYVGYLQRNSSYILLVRLTKPRIDTYASAAAGDVWVTIETELIDKGLLQ